MDNKCLRFYYKRGYHIVKSYCRYIYRLEDIARNLKKDLLCQKNHFILINLKIQSFVIEKMNKKKIRLRRVFGF